MGKNIYICACFCYSFVCPSLCKLCRSVYKYKYFCTHPSVLKCCFHFLQHLVNRQLTVSHEKIISSVVSSSKSVLVTLFKTKPSKLSNYKLRHCSKTRFQLPQEKITIDGFAIIYVYVGFDDIDPSTVWVLNIHPLHSNILL